MEVQFLRFEVISSWGGLGAGGGLQYFAVILATYRPHQYYMNDHNEIWQS